jgi:hypothetical protein
LIIAHDVGRSRDRRTAVVGGNCPVGQRRLGIVELEELPEGLYGSAGRVRSRRSTGATTTMPSSSPI